MNQTVSITHTWNRPYFPTGGAEKVYLLIEAKGIAETTGNRAPINLSLVLDRSGSMTGKPLEFSKKACQFVTEQMDAGDMLSLVTFDDEVNTIFAPCKVEHKDLMKHKIASIDSGGSTNLSGGLIEGAQHTRKGVKEGTVNRIILLSDGHANVGITDRSKLAAIAKEYSSLGIGVSTMGVGDGFDEELMESIAEHGGGNFYYIGKPDDIPSIFEQELQGLLSVVAQNIKFTLQPSGLTKITGIYGYRSEEQTGEHIVQTGDLFSQEVKSILVELAFHPHTQGKHTVLKLQCEYVDVTEGAAACNYCCEVTADFTSDINLLQMSESPEVQKQIKLMESAKAIEAAMEALDQGDLEQGKSMLKMQADQLHAYAILSDDSTLREASIQLYSQLENFNYSGKTRKELHQQKYRQMKRR